MAQYCYDGMSPTLWYCQEEPVRKSAGTARDCRKISYLACGHPNPKPMKTIIRRWLAIAAFCSPALALAQGFRLEDVKAYPFPSGLTASSQGARIAWTFDAQGKRNVFVAQGPDFTARQLTAYTRDDGQEITSLSVSADGKFVVYVRGGDHGANWDDELPVNPASTTMPGKVQLWSIPFSGGDPKLLGDGDGPVISPKSDQVAFIQGGQVWEVPVDGSAAAKNLFKTRGTTGSINWSPDGSKIAFVSDRGDHSLIGIYVNGDTPIQWIAPSFSHDSSPEWSPDGLHIAFVRTPGSGGMRDSILVRRHRPWSIWKADAATGAATLVWRAPKTLAGSLPYTHGGVNLHWAARDRIVFLSSHDGWPHLYSIPSVGGVPLLLTPGLYMAEHISMTSDGKWLLFAGNAGSDKLDIDRRHIVRVPIDQPAVEVVTPGEGLAWSPVVTGDGSTIAFLSATAQRPPLPAVMAFRKGTEKLLAENMIPSSFPTRQLVVPRQVIFTSSDGLTIHGQLFERPGGAAKKPAIVYVHGGPPRQMLLGWHYSDYYSNTYAINQYLANLGFVVLSVNYRLGIGYGFEFNEPRQWGPTGASEYLDVKAGGEWLAAQPGIDPARIGIYGGSYGGFLTAMALGRDSKLFAAGVDYHGVHEWTIDRTRNVTSPDRFERAPDADHASRLAWESSPSSTVRTWTSPVLIIHGDDDRNVRFSQSTDLVRRLEEKGVPLETLVIVDDTHHWMKYSNAIRVGNATADFFTRKLMMK